MIEICSTVFYTYVKSSDMQYAPERFVSEICERYNICLRQKSVEEEITYYAFKVDKPFFSTSINNSIILQVIQEKQF